MPASSSAVPTTRCAAVGSTVTASGISGAIMSAAITVAADTVMGLYGGAVPTTEAADVSADVMPRVWRQMSGTPRGGADEEESRHQDDEKGEDENGVHG